ncbi:MAG: VOC family protein [Ktedonobacteraceae bacterium]
MTMQLKKLTPNIMVENVKRTSTFYQDVLGFELVATVPQEGDALDWVMLKRDNVEIMFQSRASLSRDIPLFTDKAIDGSLTFHIEVADITTLYAALKEQVTLVQEMHTTFYDTQEFAILDCNGFVLAFAEPV